MKGIHRAIEACKTSGYDLINHFRGVTKMVKLSIGAERLINVNKDTFILGKSMSNMPSIILHNFLDIAEQVVIVQPVHPPSLCFFGSMLNSGGFFISPVEAP
ncbi:MAG: hypothetical protein ACOYOS_05270 [Syntrophales bacterium]